MASQQAQRRDHFAMLRLYMPQRKSIFSCQRTETRLRAKAFCPVYWFTVYFPVTSNLQTKRYTVQITLSTWNHWTSAVPSGVPVPLRGSVQPFSWGWSKWSTQAAMKPGGCRREPARVNRCDWVRSESVPGVEPELARGGAFHPSCALVWIHS